MSYCLISEAWNQPLAKKEPTPYPLCTLDEAYSQKTVGCPKGSPSDPFAKLPAKPRRPGGLPPDAGPILLPIELQPYGVPMPYVDLGRGGSGIGQGFLDTELGKATGVPVFIPTTTTSIPSRRPDQTQAASVEKQERHENNDSQVVRQDQDLSKFFREKGLEGFDNLSDLDWNYGSIGQDQEQEQEQEQDQKQKPKQGQPVREKTPITTTRAVKMKPETELKSAPQPFRLNDRILNMALFTIAGLLFILLLEQFIQLGRSLRV